MGVCVCVCVSCSVVSNTGTPWTVARQAALSMEFSRQEYWSRQPFHSPGDLPDPKIKPGSPSLETDSFLSELLGKPRWGHGAQFLWRCGCNLPTGPSRWQQSIAYYGVLLSVLYQFHGCLVCPSFSLAPGFLEPILRSCSSGSTHGQYHFHRVLTKPQKHIPLSRFGRKDSPVST